MKKIAFIVNPISGVKKKRKLPLLIREAFSHATGYNVTFYRTKCAGDATIAAQNFVTDNFDIVVAVGGDGTVNEVARGLMGSNTALGIVPFGSGNGLARHLGIPMGTRQALEYIIQAKPHKADCGLINDIPFFCTAGVGFDAVVGNKFAEAKTRGFMSYLQQIFRELITYKPERYTITIDGKIIRRQAFLVTFANASQWGNNAYIAPEASLSDGMLDLVVVSKFSFFRAPEIGIQLFIKQIDRLHFVEIFKCKSVTLKRRHDGQIHFDGEPGYLGDEVNVQVVHEAIKVLASSRGI